MGLLGDLAAMALGERPAGVARVALPPRFAPRSAPLDDTEAVPFEGQTRNNVQAVQTASQPAADALAAKTTDTMSRTALAAERLPPNRPIDPERIRIAGSAEPSALRRMPTSPAAAIPDADRTPRRTPPIANPLPPALPAIQPAATVVPPPKHAAPPVISAPLSAPAIAARTPALATPTIVKVVIDRIDVRAPAPPRPATAPTSRARPQPSVSLADYLSGRGRGG